MATINPDSKVFPDFDEELRAAMYSETELFFDAILREDRSILDLIDANFTFVNERLAKHYGIPGVTGPDWRLVKDVRKYGRGGILGLASVQAKQSGASRTSPVLRGNWVVETLLGEKLPAEVGARLWLKLPDRVDCDTPAGSREATSSRVASDSTTWPPCAAAAIRAARCTSIPT